MRLYKFFKKVVRLNINLKKNFIKTKIFKKYKIKIYKKKKIYSNSDLSNLLYYHNINRFFLKFKKFIKILGKVKKKIKGGYEVISKGIRCFLPISHSKKEKLNKKYFFLVLKHKKNNIIISRKNFLNFKNNKLYRRIGLFLKGNFLNFKNDKYLYSLNGYRGYCYKKSFKNFFNIIGIGNDNIFILKECDLITKKSIKKKKYKTTYKYKKGKYIFFLIKNLICVLKISEVSINNYLNYYKYFKSNKKNILIVIKNCNKIYLSLIKLINKTNIVKNVYYYKKYKKFYLYKIPGFFIGFSKKKKKIFKSFFIIKNKFFLK
ncbi:hypothetical protein ACT2CI_00580 [Candidatus Vidania fulgoroideorum]